MNDARESKGNRVGGRITVPYKRTKCRPPHRNRLFLNNNHPIAVLFYQTKALTSIFYSRIAAVLSNFPLHFLLHTHFPRTGVDGGFFKHSRSGQYRAASFPPDSIPGQQAIPRFKPLHLRRLAAIRINPAPRLMWRRAVQVAVRPDATIPILEHIERSGKLIPARNRLLIQRLFQRTEQTFDPAVLPGASQINTLMPNPKAA